MEDLQPFGRELTSVAKTLAETLGGFESLNMVSGLDYLHQEARTNRSEELDSLLCRTEVR